MDKAFFLDRDGVLIEEEHYISDPAKVRLCAGVPESLRRMRSAGYKVIIISNQAGIAKGYFTMKELKGIEARVDELLAAEDLALDGVYYCPHHTQGVVPEYSVECDCRKPKPGMLLAAAKDHNIDLAQSFMIGDRLTDLKAGLAAGCKAVALVHTGYGAEQDLSAFDPAVTIDAENMAQATEELLKISCV